MRILPALGFLSVILGCDRYAIAAIAISPNPAVVADSARSDAFSVAARAAARHGLEPFQARGPEANVDWKECFAKRGLALCSKLLEHEPQFLIMEYGTRLSPRADSLRRELLDSLGVRFGAARVRECTWESPRDPRQSGCPPRSPADSA